MTRRTIDLDWQTWDQEHPATGSKGGKPVATTVTQGKLEASKKQQAAGGGEQDLSAVPLDTKTQATIRSVQAHFGLPTSGVLDPATVKALNGYKSGSATSAGGASGTAAKTAKQEKAQTLRTALAAKGARQQARHAANKAEMAAERAKRQAVKQHTRVVLGSEKATASNRSMRNRVAAARLARKRGQA